MLSAFCPAASAQNNALRRKTSNARQGIDIPGKLEIVDPPPAATPVNMLSVSLFSPGKFELWADPDENGNLMFKNVLPGRYSLNLHFPSRIVSFSRDSAPLNPQNFEVEVGQSGELLI